MSHNPQDSNLTSQKPLDIQVREMLSSVHAKPSVRGIAIGIELTQRYIEYLDEIQELPKNFQTDVTVILDKETKIHFDNEGDFADWLAEHNNG